MLDPRESGLGARGGALGMRVGGVDVRLFGGRGEEDEIPSGRGPAAISGEGAVQPRNSPRPGGRSCYFPFFCTKLEENHYLCFHKQDLI